MNERGYRLPPRNVTAAPRTPERDAKFPGRARPGPAPLPARTRGRAARSRQVSTHRAAPGLARPLGKSSRDLLHAARGGGSLPRPAPSEPPAGPRRTEPPPRHPPTPGGLRVALPPRSRPPVLSPGPPSPRPAEAGGDTGPPALDFGGGLRPRQSLWGLPAVPGGRRRQEPLARCRSLPGGCSPGAAGRSPGGACAPPARASGTSAREPKPAASSMTTTYVDPCNNQQMLP